MQVQKEVLASEKISDDIKQFSYEIGGKNNIIIRYMETEVPEGIATTILNNYIGKGQPELTLVKIVGYEVCKAGSSLASDNGGFTP